MSYKTRREFDVWISLGADAQDILDKKKKNHTFTIVIGGSGGGGGRSDYTSLTSKITWVVQPPPATAPRKKINIDPPSTPWPEAGSAYNYCCTKLG
jgi:hypothetical protein